MMSQQCNSRDRFEGDIVTLVNPKANAVPEDSVNTNGQGIILHNAVRQNYLKWADARIPYTVSTQYTSFGRSRIAAAIQEYNEKTCIRFEPKTNKDTDYIHILPDDGCYSMVGNAG